MFVSPARVPGKLVHASVSGESIEHHFGDRSAIVHAYRRSEQTTDPDARDADGVGCVSDV